MSRQPPRRLVVVVSLALSILASLLVVAPVAAQQAHLVFELTGAAEVPGPGDPDGAGGGSVALDDEAGTVCFGMGFEGIDTPTAAHIHEGGPDEAGPVVVPIFAEPADGVIEGCTEGVDPALIAAIAADPAAYYVNVHTGEFPDGAIRGQLEEAPPEPPTFFAGLSGAAEVPGPGDPDGIGFAAVTILLAESQACFFLQVRDIAPATAAHVHVGGPEEAGPPVITLTPPTPEGFAEGCVEDVDPAVLQAILDNPTGYYVNVHTEEFPDGAIRGQLSTEPPPPPECTPPELCDGLAVPGQYVYGGFAASLSFALDRPWFSLLFPDGFSLDSMEMPGAVYAFRLQPTVYTGECGATPAQIPVTIQAFTEFLTTHPNVSVVTAPAQATLGGAAGVSVEVTGVGGGACPGGAARLFAGAPIPGLPPEASDFVIAEGERIRFYVLDVAGQVVWVAVDAFDGGVWDELLAHAQPILDSMAFALPPGPPPPPTESPTAAPTASPTQSVAPGVASPRPTATSTPRGRVLPNTAVDAGHPSGVPLILGGIALAGALGILATRRRSRTR